MVISEFVNNFIVDAMRAAAKELEQPTPVPTLPVGDAKGGTGIADKAGMVRM